LWALAGRPSLHEHRLPTGEDKRVTLTPTISTSGDRLMPWPLGTLEILDEGRRTRHVLHDPRGPCHTVRGKPDPVKGYSNTLLWADGHVRRLSPKELWHAQGGTDTGWVLLREDGWKIDELLQVAARALPPAIARAAVQWALRALQDDVPPLDERPKVGSGHDPERQANDAALAAWLRCWREDPRRPQDAYEAWLKERPDPHHSLRAVLAEEDDRPTDPTPEPGADLIFESEVCGGAVTFAPEAAKPDGPGPLSRSPSERKARATGRARRSSPSRRTRSQEPVLIRPQKMYRRDISIDEDGPTMDCTEDWLARKAAEAITAKLAEGTRDSYGSGLRQWLLWCKVRGRSAYLTGESMEQRKKGCSSTLLSCTRS
jgi:hypothetical protein